MSPTRSRTPQEVFAHHGQALAAGHLDGIAADYTDDSVLITPSGIARGRDGVRKAFAEVLAELPDAEWDLKNQIFDGDLLFLEWAADSALNRVDDGVDTFVFRDGMIRAQTVRYTAQPKTRSER
jgi:ketosteroid isomerase-like protein